MPTEAKVRASLCFQPGQMTITPTKIDFDDNFKNKLYDVEEYIRSKVILEINEFAGGGWNLNFIDNPMPKPAYIVEVTLTDLTHLDKIVYTVRQAFPDHFLTFFLNGAGSPFAIIGTQ